ncbi:hypothetical protein [Paludibacterium paludis]|uniref:Winged helix DNA-binding protein n=1 Tax=Paludibacterium paludis TaxID=1225769 RepID=A0A918NYS5_9NEIS|nr:hypothetical protein [Paludibacterium paludis]GGY06969.1 hypothetical protein GCM10011289_06920 [Paludibacterium paludis]
MPIAPSDYLTAASRLINDFQELVCADVPLVAISIFFALPPEGAAPRSEIVKQAAKEVSSGAVSRAFSLLAGLDKTRKAESKITPLVEFYPDPKDRRHQLVQLTPKGREVRGEMLDRASRRGVVAC